MFNRVNNELERLSEQLDTTIDFDAIGIKFEICCDPSYWKPFWFHEPPRKDQISENRQTAINRMTDYLPNGMEGYGVTPEVLDSFKSAMHQLCDEEKMSARTLWYALNKSIDTIQLLLNDLHNKVLNPRPHLYEKLWDKILSSYEDDGYVYRFHGWYQDIGTPSIEDLKAKQRQEIYEFLRKGFFRYAKLPTGAELKKRKLKIVEDDLEVGCEVTNEFEINCGKFDRFIEWQEDCILIINPERIGQYIYKNYSKLDEEDFFNIKDFDSMMELIHEEMARLKPCLAKYLKRYQENQDEEFLNDCKKIFAPFKVYLKEELRKTIIDEYLEKLLFDSELKEEAMKNMRGQSIKKYCCSIVLALSYCNIFKPEYNNSNIDLGAALNTGFDWDNKDTFIRYLKDPEINSKALRSWTSNIMDELKEHPFTRTKTG